MLDFILISNTLIILALAVMSPGPDFFLVLRNSLSYGRKAGFFTALGTASGCCISFTILICGLKFLFTYPLIKIILAWVCGCYLIYLGVQSIIAKAHHSQTNYHHGKVTQMSVYYRNGLFTNLLNPKLYTISGAILTYTEQQHPSLATNITIIIGNALIAIIWFSLVSLLLSQNKIQKAYFKKELLINKILGLILIIVGGKIILG